MEMLSASVLPEINHHVRLAPALAADRYLHRDRIDVVSNTSVWQTLGVNAGPALCSGERQHNHVINRNQNLIDKISTSTLQTVIDRVAMWH